MTNVRFVHALASAGKTYAAAKKTSEDAAAGRKILFVQPTKKLIAETVDHTFKIQGVDPSIVTEFSERTCPDGGIVASIIKHMSQSPTGRGEIVVITHAAFVLLAQLFKGAQRRHCATPLTSPGEPIPTPCTSLLGRKALAHDRSEKPSAER